MDAFVKSFDRPDEVGELPRGHAQIVRLGDQLVIRGELEPGWRWSNDWQPVMGTASCQMPHTGVVLSGQWHFEMDDGSGFDLEPGDAYAIPAGDQRCHERLSGRRTLSSLPRHRARHTCRGVLVTNRGNSSGRGSLSQAAVDPSHAKTRQDQ